MVDVRLSYTKGLDRYYGLLELAIEAGIFPNHFSISIVDSKLYLELNDKTEFVLVNGKHNLGYKKYAPYDLIFISGSVTIFSIKATAS